MTEQPQGMVPARAPEKTFAPISAGNVQISSQKELDALLTDTMGKASSVLDGLDIFRQGKEDYFKVGDKKVASVLGIFVMSRRPTRAFWQSEELQGKAPDCHSLDGVVPHPDTPKPQSKTCEECPMNKPGSGKGRAKKCKQKAADFILVVPEDCEKNPDGSMYWPNPARMTPGVLMYSISNAGSSRAYATWQRVLREKNLRAQGAITRWKFGEDESKGGTTYNYVEPEFVAPIPDPSNDSAVWQSIIASLSTLKGGAAEEILTLLSGSNEPDSPVD